MEMTVAEIAALVGAEADGDVSAVISGVAPIDEAEPGHITFLTNRRYERHLATTGATAIIVPQEYERSPAIAGKTVLLAANAYATFAKVVGLFEDRSSSLAVGIHRTAFVADTAVLGKDVAVGPCATIMGGARIGDGSVINSGVYVGPDALVGSGTTIHANATVRERVCIGDRVIVHSGAVIGSDGFGFARDGGVNLKIPQIGIVVVEDDVEIGANVTIDRATIGATTIRHGTKIDNLVQVAHNVTIGEDSVIVAQTGISGSTRVGKGVVLAGQSGIVGHIEIGDGAVVAAQAGVMSSVPAGACVSGYPARRHSVAKRISACVTNLPVLFRRVRALEKRLEELDRED
jgi:UDP-3-O-[3-hydroxymyristoyl] glucosamine N-acyltransferase